jgi:RHS repeat-associated protein
VAYFPYGDYAPGLPVGADDFRPKFQGKEFYSSIGLYYFGARYYDPSIGRFISPDSQIGAKHIYREDALNRFAFALNNPLIYVDPTGHLSRFWKEFISITIDVAEIGGGIAAEFIPGVGPVIGATLIGAGISGLAYNIETLATGEKFSWGKWGINEGVGAIGGAVTGGAGMVGARLAETAAVRGIESIALRTAARVGIKALAGMAGGALAPVVSKPFKNWWEGKGFNEKGLSWASVGWGAGFGAVGAVASEGIGFRFATEEDVFANMDIFAENPTKVGTLISRFGPKGEKLFKAFMPFVFNTKNVLYNTRVLPQ